MRNHYDVLVLGVGGVGSAALMHLARRGAHVLGLDSFEPGHDRGSSHGETRVIRMAYFEHPDYVPLLRRAYELWEELQQDSGRDLYRETGLIQIGPPKGEVVAGVLRSAREHGLAVERLEARDIRTRYPGFDVPPGEVGVLEKRAGFLRVEDCVRAHAERARAAGAQLIIGATVVSWEAGGGKVTVVTDHETYTADRLVITAGAWSGKLVTGLGVPLQVLRKGLFWFEAENPVLRLEAGCPIFLYETGRGIFYGFPALDEKGIKVAMHSGGTPVTDPLALTHEPDPVEQGHVVDFMKRHLLGATGGLTHHKACMYTMTPDQNFLVDRHPHHREVVFAAGLSGHGFKFTSVLGEALAEMALEGETRHPVEFLGLSRPSLAARPGA